MTPNMIGACLCGSIKFEIHGVFQKFFLCHCGRCRKDTGSAHAANLFSSTAKIVWLSGTDKIKTYRVPASLHEKSFCSECGSAVPSLQMDGKVLVVPAGSVDSEIHIRPDAHICLASRATWDTRLDDIPGVDGLPTS